MNKAPIGEVEVMRDLVANLVSQLSILRQYEEAFTPLCAQMKNLLGATDLMIRDRKNETSPHIQN